MKILVTGGAGFIASHVTDAYIAAGHQVLVIDNLSTGKREHVHAAAAFVECDITDQARVQAEIAAFAPEIINMHAAHIQVGNSVKHPQFDATNNILALLNIMQAAVKVGGVKKVLLASTGGAMYGDQSVPFDESMEAAPLSPYGISKRAGELYLQYYYFQYQIPFVALRYSNVYGPRQNPHGESGVVAIFSEMIAAGKQPIINGDGLNTRDYIHVTDVVRANLAATNREVTGWINIGSNTQTSTNEIFHLVSSAFGSNVQEQHGPARPGEQKRSMLSYQKAKELLDWEPTVPLNEGISEVVAWYQSRAQ